MISRFLPTFIVFPGAALVVFLLATGRQAPGQSRELPAHPAAPPGNADVSRAGSTDLNEFRKLREERRYADAAAQAEYQLTRSDLADRQRVEWTIELARTYTMQAILSPHEKRPDAWQKAHETLARFIDRHPHHRRLLLLRLQDGLTHSVRGELAQTEGQLLDNSAMLAEGVHELRVAALALEKLGQEIASELAVTNRHGSGKRWPRPVAAEPATHDVFSQDELISLERSVALETARAYRLLATSSAPTGADWIDSVQQATAQLNKLKSMSAESNLGSLARLEEIQLLALRKNWEQAAAKVEELLSERLSDSVRARADAKRLRIEIGRGNLTQAIERAAASNSAPGSRPDSRDRAEPPSPELELARLEVWVAAAREATDRHDPAAAERFQKQAAAQVEHIAVHFGPFWRTRAELVLTKPNKPPRRPDTE